MQLQHTLQTVTSIKYWFHKQWEVKTQVNTISDHHKTESNLRAFFFFFEAEGDSPSENWKKLKYLQGKNYMKGKAKIM
jgi:hypothetical protein